MLEQHRYDLIVVAGRKLDKAQMLRFEERTGFLYSTDLGRIASHFYIKYDTVEVRISGLLLKDVCHLALCLFILGQVGFIFC